MPPVARFRTEDLEMRDSIILMDAFNAITDESEDEHSIATTTIGVTVDWKAPVFDPSRKRGGSIKNTFVCRSLCAVAYFAATSL